LLSDSLIDMAPDAQAQRDTSPTRADESAGAGTRKGADAGVEEPWFGLFVSKFLLNFQENTGWSGRSPGPDGLAGQNGKAR
jgi:hypothetical protein